MPKSRPQRRIDRNVAQVARNITVTGGGVGGGLTSHTHSQYATDAEVIARVASAIATHSADEDAHHDRLHDVLSTEDHDLTANAYALLGATTTDTLGLLYIASSGDGIDVAKNNATFTIAVDVSDFDGAGLGDDGSNNLYVKTAEGVTLNGDNVTVDESYDFAWTGDHTHASTVGSPSFASGFTGSGWRIDTAAASLELNDLTVRGRLSVYELLLRQIRATNGNVFVSDAAKIATVSGSGPFTLSVADDDVHGFAVGDLIRAQRFNGDGVYQSNMQVTSVTNTQTFVATLTSGDDPAAGMDFVRLGNASDSDRRGSIYLSSADTYAPYIDVVDGVDAFTDWNSTDVLKMRMGRLDGITDPDFGVLSGYGLYVKGGGYFKGDVAAASAEVVLNTYGLNLAAAGATVDNTGASAISWTSTPLEPTAATLTGHISSSNFETSGTVYNRMSLGVPFGTTTLTDEALLGLYLNSSDDGDDNLYFILETSGTINGTESYSGRRAWIEADNFFVQSRMVVAGDIVPFLASTSNIGSADSPWAELHVDTLYAGTVSSVDTGHNHNDLYYTKAQIDSQATGYAASSHTHASYITSATLTSTLADYVTPSGLTTTLADYYTEAEADALLADKSSVGHTHDSRYYTESEVDSLLAGYSVTGHTHDDRYYTETEVDDLLAAGVTPTSHDLVSSHSVTAAQYAVLSTWGAANTLSMVTATADGTAGNKLLRTDANGDLTLNDVVINDITGANATLSGYITSDDYVSGVSGWQINGGDAEFGALTARGAFRSAVFEIGSTAVFSSRQLIVKSSGKMAESLAIATSGGTEYDLNIDYPSRGEFAIAEVGDVLRVRGLASYTVATASGNSTSPVWEFWAPQVRPSGLTPVDIWFTITGIVKGAGYYTYTCDWEYGSDNVTILAGEAVAVYGQSGDGVIESVATGTFAPYINIATHSGSPWTDETAHVRMGQLGGLSAIRAATDEWGIAAGTDLSDNTAAYLIASTQQLAMQNVDITRKASGTVTGVWDADGISLLADLETDIGADWYEPEYSSITWSTTPDDIAGGTTWGTLRLASRRVDADPTLDIDYVSESYLEMYARSTPIVAGDGTEALSVMRAGVGSGTAYLYVGAYDYIEEDGTYITAVADTVGITATAITLSGALRFGALPTSITGLTPGAIYVDENGFLKQVQ